MAGNDLLTRSVKTPFGNDWVYLVDVAGNIEGRVAVTDLLALGTGESNTSSNVGTGAQLAKAKIGVNLPFRTLRSEGRTVTFIQNTDDINLEAVRVGVYRNIYIAAGAMIGNFTDGAETGTSETPTNNVMNDYYEFAAGVNSHAQFSMMMPDEWDLGQLKFKFFWTNSTVIGAGDVSFGITMGVVSDSETIDVAFPSTSFVTDTFEDATDLHVTPPASRFPLSPALQDILYFRVTRPDSDTYTQAARLLGVAIQYKELKDEPAEWA